MTTTGGWLGLSDLGISIKREIGIRDFHGEAVTSQIRCLPAEPLVQKARLHESVKISIVPTRGFQLALCGGNGAQGLNR